MLKTGVIATSRKENERRVPIYPDHLLWIDERLRHNMRFERGYGTDYGYNDDYFAEHAGGVASREDLFSSSEMLILPKPVLADLQSAPEGQILWGWVHCVQQRDIAQAAIDRKLTLIAWEAMHHWSAAGNRLMHMFYKNNELAGYAAVLHALQLLGLDGHYGPRRHVTVISYGSVSRGAIYALQGRGFNNIHVFTQRPTHLVADQNPDVYYGQLSVNAQGEIHARLPDGSLRPFIDELAEADIICNGIMQDTDRPLVFVNESTLARLKPRAVIIDISCDKEMGFSFARPTTFEEPVFTLGEHITYYSVDHTPSYLWNAASREISRALLPHLPTVLAGPEAWSRDETIRKAIEMCDGVIRNPRILSFQHRHPDYPHQILT